jgi:AraC family transcriptional regulator
MAEEMIVPDQLPRWVPGEITLESPTVGWAGVSVRGYRYNGSDVEVPALRDYMIVAFCRGRTTLNRRTGGAWVSEDVGAGDVSLLTRAAASHWVWPGTLEVVHVYLTGDELAATCRQMYEREVDEIELHDTLRADDPLVHRTVLQLAHEATQGAIGSRLMVDSLACQLAVQILRRHAHVAFKEQGGAEALTFGEDRAVRDYVHEHIAESISLDDLAAVLGMSRFHFARRFRATTGASPHEFVLRQRVDRVRTLLERTDTPLLDIAVTSGFADQSHMTREFKKRTGVTPGRFRSRSR